MSRRSASVSEIPVHAHSLQLGESKSTEVKACRRWNCSGIHVYPEGTYELLVEGKQVWFDWHDPATADGYESEKLRKWERFRRIPSAKWFALVGTLDRDLSTHFVIGRQRREFRPMREGTLWFFANDLSLMYWNNTGSLQLTVKRTS